MAFENLDFLLERCRGRSASPVAVAAAHDADVLTALDSARREGIVEPILIGSAGRIAAMCHDLGLDLTSCPIVDVADDETASRRAVALVASGEARMVMKGQVKTATLLKAVLDKKEGLRTGSVLSHLFLLEIPRLGRVCAITDGGLNTYPTLQEKVHLIENAVACYRRLGVDCPRVAVLAAVETVNPAMACTLDAAALTQMNRRGQIRNCLVDGPLALDNAVSLSSAHLKGIDSDVAGRADILLMPHIEAGNLVGKVALSLLGSRGAGAVLGAKAPVILTSRTDSAETKLLSIALGVLLS
ncbi:bifunctional enoyl-CoA hydratase/phosphate acetyltransferase [Aminithiophilus ramosus]|uniref:Bifunctional enoyl-CoA hydratase/phosphate acetyltransferase n=2 Tax=Synergistales TaxID=649776 RepID=A0A9Q7AD90_9BACT|nr:bifunctional enoyl-CoA hydratase/phosphate acetyltransferase [Aminithiophilus ramosus]QTX32703.1 bifunctional enoyl-CoA hydratase/phosphate acetyltransferase [Aminithiophilus ramosus]QVL36579.1 bifunctional enoyl-CoA hydratase/phosphate acetyltransferase [Synergistota bacterium]